MRKFENANYDCERALYGIDNAEIIGCRFEGPADGESALKETSDITVKDCIFKLRYPFWHTTNATVSDIHMTDTCRAAMWYDCNLNITNSYLGGIKALRECKNVSLSGCEVNSTEFGWFCNNVQIKNTKLTSEYQFLKCKGMEIDNLEMNGKYSFQYAEDVVIKNSVLNTKDAFWHCHNITVINSTVRGEYLGWYSENLHLINCKITGTQPLCYAKGLILENCEMTDCDLSFEKSDVKATVIGEITSVKNPYSGYIKADAIGEIITEYPSDCIIETNQKQGL